MSEVFADEQLAAWVRSSTALGELDDVGAMRTGIAQRARTRARGPEVESVGELRAGDRPARLYRPSDGAIALVLYLHGGGWSVGSLESHGSCVSPAGGRLRRGGAGARLPAGPRGSLAGVGRRHGGGAVVDRRPRLGRAQIDHGSGAVAGDSAGGTLATLACLRLGDEDPGALPDLQVLLYANTDLPGRQPSMREKASGWGT